MAADKFLQGKLSVNFLPFFPLQKPDDQVSCDFNFFPAQRPEQFVQFLWDIGFIAAFFQNIVQFYLKALQSPNDFAKLFRIALG